MTTANQVIALYFSNAKCLVSFTKKQCNCGIKYLNMERLSDLHNLTVAEEKIPNDWQL